MNKRIPIAWIDRLMEKLRRMPESYPVNQSGENYRFQPESWCPYDSYSENGRDWGRGWGQARRQIV